MYSPSSIKMTFHGWDLCRGGWLVLQHPLKILSARRHDDVMPVLRQVEAAAAAGHMAAGFIAYEAAPAFDPAMVTHAAGRLPLLCFAVFPGQAPESSPPWEGSPMPGSTLPELAPALSETEYVSACERIRSYIAAGDTYQVNFCFPLRGLIRPPASGGHFLPRNLHQNQPNAFFADIHLEDQRIVSVSPELFCRLDGNSITCRPMKGTAPRGCTAMDDDSNRAALHHSQKDRAENLMIVDMMRNDLGRVARTGTVRTTSLFEVERYPTLFQMTSTVQAETSAALPDIIRALFPCSSVTGAPKLRTMEIIAELEKSPRGVYTGCIGLLGPGRQAQLSVAIRTLHLDQTDGRVEYGVGSGVVWDSDPKAEYRECRLKAEVLQPAPEEFDLLETMLWEPHAGYRFLSDHLDRLSASASYFGLPSNRRELEASLRRASVSFADRPTRVRLLVSRRGEIRVESSPLGADFTFESGPDAPRSGKPLRVRVVPCSAQSSDRFLYHKTTRRQVYSRARAAAPEADDAVLVNERGELTESTTANLVIRRGDRFLTPPLSSGLLPGVYRARLIQEGVLREAVLLPQDLEAADEIFLINSVRGWMRAERVCP